MCAADALDWKGWVVIASLILAFIILALDKVGPDLVFTAVLAFYTAVGVLDAKTAAEGYANTGLLTVVFLYIVAEGVFQTGALESFITRVLGRSRAPFWGIVRLMIPCMFLSAFLNNTPIVALLTPIVLSWSHRTGVPAKKLLIPMSYASIFGGTCTLIGTSTNLVITGAQSSRYKNLPQFGMFEIAPVGVPYAIAGFLFLLITAKWLLPGNGTPSTSNVLAALRVLSTASPVVGKSMIDAGLHSMYNCQVTALVRKDVWHTNLSSDLVLEDGDVLYLSGEWSQIIFWAEELGLEQVPAEQEGGMVAVPEMLSRKSAMDAARLGPQMYVKTVEVMVPKGSEVVGVSIQQLQPRRRLQCDVLAISRRADRPDSRLADQQLQVGDTVVLGVGVGAGDLEGVKAAFGSEAGTPGQVHVLQDAFNKQFVVGLRVEKTLLAEPVAGQTLSGAGLRGIPGISVIGLDRQGDPQLRTAPVSRTHVLEVGDVVWAAADVLGVTFLAKYPGLVLAQQEQVDKTGVHKLDQVLLQVVVGAHSELVGHSACELSFRHKYNAAVVGMHRAGMLRPLNPSTEALEPGDVLLVSASVAWAHAHRNNQGFVIITQVPSSSPRKKSRGPLAIVLGLAMVLTQVIPGIGGMREWINLWPASVLTGMIMLLIGCMSGNDARSSIQWDVYLAVAGAFGVSRAMEKTGVANEFAQVFISIAKSIGGRASALIAIYLATALLTEILTNNAAGAIMFPIAAIAGDALGVDPRDVSIAIMLGASAAFINPFGYQCNMMVYNAGGYRFRDFMKVGIPLQVFLLVAGGLILTFMDSWGMVWAVAFSAAFLVIGLPAAWACLPARTTAHLKDKFLGVFGGVHREGGAAVNVVVHTPSAADSIMIDESWLSRERKTEG